MSDVHAVFHTTLGRLISQAGHCARLDCMRLSSVYSGCRCLARQQQVQVAC